MDNEEHKRAQYYKYLNDRGAETSRQLMEADIPIPDAVIDGILYRGELTLMAASAKAGKSVLIMQMGIAVGNGENFLEEFPAKRGAVLVYDVDDGSRPRTQRRLEDLGQKVENENIIFIPTLRTVFEGAIEQIEGDVTAAKSAGQDVLLVVIDCLLSILPCGVSRNAVQEQRKQLEALRDLAIKHQFALLIVHHTRKKAPKMADGFGAFDGMLGTTGIATVLDVGIMLENTGRDGEVTARVTGRNPGAPAAFTMRLDREGCTGWHIVDGAEKAGKRPGMGRVAKAMCEVLERVGKMLTPTEIVAEAKRAGMDLNLSSVKVNCRRGRLTHFVEDNGRYGVRGVTDETVLVNNCETSTSNGYTPGLQEVKAKSSVTEPGPDESLLLPAVDNPISSVTVSAEETEAVLKTPATEVALPAVGFVATASSDVRHETERESAEAPVPLTKRIHAVLKEEDRNMTVDVLAERLGEDEDEVTIHLFDLVRRGAVRSFPPMYPRSVPSFRAA